MSISRWFVMGTLLGLTSGCASTGLTDSWVAPGAGPLALRNTLVIVMHPVDTVRTIGEGRLVQRIGPRRAVASHTLFSLDELRDTEAARAKVAAQGFEEAIVMRVVARENVLSYHPSMVYPAEYGQFWGFIGYVAPQIYGPVVTQGGSAVFVETNLYSIDNEQLVWSGVSRSVDALDIVGTIDDIVDAVGTELRRQGLLRG